MDATARFALPYILPGQAQKEAFHNEALLVLNALVHPAVEDVRAEPPAAPVEGQQWIVGPDPAGAWSEKAGQVAVWTVGGWRFLAPRIGMSVWDAGLGSHRRWTGAIWTAGEISAAAILINGLQVLGPRAGAVSSPSGGTIIDAEARASLDAVIVALRSHGLIE